MGLFSKGEICSICGKKAGSLTRAKIADGFVCGDCLKYTYRFANFGTSSVTNVKKHIEKVRQDTTLYLSLTPSGEVSDYLKVFSSNRLWCAAVKKKSPIYLFSFDDIINYELLEDGVSVATGGLGSAIAGATLFGGAGAIVGANLGKKQKDIVDNLSVHISTRVPEIPSLNISLINTETKRGGFVYKGMKDLAIKIISLLDQITADNNTAPIPPSSSSNAADEILKFKSLLDAGVITQEEFEAKKKQLLGL
jgi:hypothetical protein